MGRFIDTAIFAMVAIYAGYCHDHGNTDSALFFAVVALWFKPDARGDA